MVSGEPGMSERDDGHEIEPVTVMARPHTAGWVRVGPREWELPDGRRYRFPKGQPQRISVYRRRPDGRPILLLPRP